MQRRLFPRLKSTHRLFFTFTATILLPGILLGFFGFRALLHERQLADQQIRERLLVSAETMGRRLEQELSAWQQAAEQIIQAGETNPALWPARVHMATKEAGTLVVLLGKLGNRKQVKVLPAGQVLYSLAPMSETPNQAAFMAEAESLEMREKNYERAIALYRGLLVSRKPPERTIALYRLARTLKKAGRSEDALRSFRLVDKEATVLIGSLPSNLLALHEVALLERQSGSVEKSADAALHLYRDLVYGRWQLEKASYAFYSERVREMLTQSAEVGLLEQVERRKLALSVAAEHFLDDPRPIAAGPDGYWLAFWRSKPFGAVVLSESSLRRHLWPSVFNAVETRDLQYALIAPTGQLLFGVAPTKRERPVTPTLAGVEPQLRLQVWPGNEAALYGSMGLRQNLYLGMLGVVVALLTFGAYLTVRTVRTELAMAQMKSDFVSTVSHEFRSPLAGITQLGEMLRDGRVKDEEHRQHYYEMIVGETQRLRRLVENVLDFSRMEDSRKRYCLEPFDPAPWLRHVVDDFQSEVAHAGFSLQARIPEDLPATVGDQEALRTAVHNLLDNAVKYSRESRTVCLEACANGDGLAIAVRDHGAGIREDDRPHIFEKFFRGGGELARQVKGAGLGLSLVKHIIAAHGGAVDFETKEGEGSTFTIHLKTGA
jgi:signal transduction histidine kinase/tetratricopeptide (TPR) repeat protein